MNPTVQKKLEYPLYAKFLELCLVFIIVIYWFSAKMLYDLSSGIC